MKITKSNKSKTNLEAQVIEHVRSAINCTVSILQADSNSNMRDTLNDLSVVLMDLQSK